MLREECSIVSVKSQGRTVKLDDGSTWNVPIGDNTISVCWYETQRIIIEESGNPDYPYKLRNLDTSGNVVKAKKVRSRSRSVVEW